MPKASELFASKFIAVPDLNGLAHVVTIERVVKERVRDRMTEVLYFAKRKKGLVLKPTIGRQIAAICGDELDGWIGQEIELFVTKVEYEDELVDAVRARKVPSPDSKSDPQAGF